MICKDVVAKTTDSLERALPETERREWESHAAVCPDCARYIAQMRTTIALLARLRFEPAEDAPTL